jgi:hypothetical protein
VPTAARGGAGEGCLKASCVEREVDFVNLNRKFR